MPESLLIDYNGFFASCEQQDRPELRGRPVAVVPLMSEHTSCIAASYDAKRAGIKVGTPVTEARLRCPGIAIVESRPEIYLHYHKKLIEAVETCLPVTEVWSIDEVWCRLPAGMQTREQSLAVAKKIKVAITRLAGAWLTCSIGLAPNAWLAKIASDLEKPDGLVVIEPEELPQRLFSLALRDLPGVGENMEARLLAEDIDSVEKLCAADLRDLRRIWGGIEGERMWRRLRGEEVPLPPRHTSSLGHAQILSPDLRNPEGARATLHRLLQKAALRLRHGQLYAGGMHLALKYNRSSGPSRWSTAVTFTDTQDTLELIRVLNLLWDRRPARRTDHFSVGVTLFALVPEGSHTATLPGLLEARPGDDARRAAVNATLDHINKKLGKHSVVYGGARGALAYAPIRIAFQRIPDLVLEEGEPDGELFPTSAELASARRL
ncbi:MAG: DNA polymerase [Burkholderiales bacterium]|nr:DNA polymerase [Opitutaceae bacterium]